MLGGHLPLARQPVGRCRLESEPQVEFRVPDNNDERTSSVSKPRETTFHKLAADASSLIRWDDSHRSERRAHQRTDRQRAEHDVAHDHAIGNRDQR